jgi:hypothetical protein
MALEPLTIDNAESTLRQMLTEAGLSLSAFQLEAAWDVFAAFCQLPIEAESDGILVQWGSVHESLVDTLRRGNKIGFYFSVLRQFEAGEYELKRLTLEWHYPLNGILPYINNGNSGWCFSDEDCDFVDFLREQREFELFQLLKSRIPYETLIFQDNAG